MGSQYELISYLLNEYLIYFESEYNFGTMTFSEWISEVSKLDYYKNKILELKKVLG